MNGRELQDLRRKQGWNVDQLGRLLKEGLGRGSASSVRNYERTKEKPIPADIAAFLNELTFERQAADAGFLEDESPAAAEGPTTFGGDTGDTAPPPPTSPVAGQPPFSSGNAYARVCEELFDMIATGLGLVGAGTGSEKLQEDGRIIHADKQALGRAYGKLAETNATFRKMLEGMTTSGAWLEVMLVSGITGGKILRNHAPPRALGPGPEKDEDDDNAGLHAVI